jgi:hypothetical protein
MKKSENPKMKISIEPHSSTENSPLNINFSLNFVDVLGELLVIADRLKNSEKFLDKSILHPSYLLENNLGKNVNLVVKSRGKNFLETLQEDSTEISIAPQNIEVIPVSVAVKSIKVKKIYF